MGSLHEVHIVKSLLCMSNTADMLISIRCITENALAFFKLCKVVFNYLKCPILKCL